MLNKRQRQQVCAVPLTACGAYLRPSLSGCFPMRRALWTPTHLVGESDIYISDLLRFLLQNTYYCLGSLLEPVLRMEWVSTSHDSSLLFNFHRKSCHSAVIWCVCVLVHASFHIHVWVHHINQALGYCFFPSFVHLVCQCNKSLWPTDIVLWQESTHSAVCASFIFTLVSVAISRFPFKAHAFCINEVLFFGL